MINIYILRRDENIKLLKLLEREIIKEEFVWLMNSILKSLPTNRSKMLIDQQRFAYDLLLIINKILLDNLYSKVVSNQLSQLMHLIQNKLFCKDLYIRPSYVYDLYTDYTGNKLEDYAFYDAERDIEKILENYIAYIYNNDSDRYNEVFISIINMFQEELSCFLFNRFKLGILHDGSPIIATPALKGGM